jgi:hypothetical protein
MRQCSHDRDVVQNAIVDLSLTWQSGQSVSLALYFVPVNRPVHNRKIDSCNSLAQAEFFDDSSIRIPRMKALVRS